MGFSLRPPKSTFEKSIHGIGLYELVAVSTTELRISSGYGSKYLMDSAWGKENQKSRMIVRFVSSKHFYSGQIVQNYSISEPTSVVYLIHLVGYKVNVCTEGFTAGNHTENSAIRLPHLCHHLLSWTLIPSSKGRHNTNEYFPSISQIQQKKQVHFIVRPLQKCFSQLNSLPFLQLHRTHSPRRWFLGMKPLSLLKENDVKSCSIRWMYCPAMFLYLSIYFLDFH